MEDEAPAPWQELFLILRQSRNPQAAALCWIQEAKFSSLFPKRACFQELLSYLGSLVPQVDSATNRLNMVPRIVCYNQGLQRNLLCILARHDAELPKELVKKFTAECEQCYLSAENKTLLYYLSLIDGSLCTYAANAMLPSVEKLLKAPSENINSSMQATETTSRPKYLSKLTETFLNKCPDPANISMQTTISQANCTSRKRPLDDIEHTVAKKARLDISDEKAETSCSPNAKDSPDKIKPCEDEVKDKSDVNVDELRAFITTKDIKAFCGVLRPTNSSVIRQQCMEVYPQGAPVEWLSNVAENLLEESGPESIEVFLNAVCLPIVQAIKTTAARKFVQLIQSISVQFSDLVLNQLLVPLVANGIVEKVRVTFLVNVIRGHIGGCHVCVLLESALRNKLCAQNNFEGLMSLLQSLLNLNFAPDGKVVDIFCDFIVVYGTEQQKSFAFVKTIMAFLKNCGKILDESHLKMIKRVLDANKTTLKNACLALIDVT
uniref:Uncharacterized protein LOC100186252 n=1 Tax=Phallusia mammillata TaxID=59560 RepID=A0A6F9DHQ2_9ASCI|nr:uncharacterized protein LOC100186252 [Phallusia mammillata]